MPPPGAKGKRGKNWAMQCMNCGSRRTQVTVVNERPNGAGARRTRKCLDCSSTWGTVELHSLDYRNLVDRLRNARRYTQKALETVLKHIGADT